MSAQIDVLDGPKTALLRTYADKVAVSDTEIVKNPRDYRLERWLTRELLWNESGLVRVRSCGRWAITPDGAVQVRANGASVGYAGLASCGSPWACPVCNMKIQTVRRLEVGVAISQVVSEGGGGAFGTYTLQHGSKDPLDPLWRSLSACWKSVLRDWSVKRLKASMLHVGTIRAAEVTHGRNGFHPHLHAVHLFARPVSDDEASALHIAELKAWKAAAGRLGLRSPSERAQDLHVIRGNAGEAMADYFTKAVYQPSEISVGYEMTSTQTKSKTRAKQSRTPWEILDSIRLDGDADDLALWHHFEQASKGKRAISWTRGLRQRVGLEVEATDEEIAAAEVGTSEDAGFTIGDWLPIRTQPALGAQLLAVIKNGNDWQAGRLFCKINGIDIRNSVQRLATYGLGKD